MPVQVVHTNHLVACKPFNFTYLIGTASWRPGTRSSILDCALVDMGTSVVTPNSDPGIHLQRTGSKLLSVSYHPVNVAKQSPKCPLFWRQKDDRRQEEGCSKMQLDENSESIPRLMGGRDACLPVKRGKEGHAGRRNPLPSGRGMEKYWSGTSSFVYGRFSVEPHESSGNLSFSATGITFPARFYIGQFLSLHDQSPYPPHRPQPRLWLKKCGCQLGEPQKRPW